jgi:plastocyanin
MKSMYLTLLVVALFGAGCWSPIGGGTAQPSDAIHANGEVVPPEAPPANAPTPVQKPAAKPAEGTKVQLQPSAGTTKVPPGSHTYTVTITDTGFSPATMAVNVGDKVTWVNKSTKPQTSASAGNTLWDSGNIPIGSSYTRTFNAPGSYNYVSGSTQLKGTVVVH